MRAMSAGTHAESLPRHFTWSGVRTRSAECLHQLARLIFILFREAKINKLHVPVLIEQDVLELQVAMIVVSNVE